MLPLSWKRHLPNGKEVSALGFGCSSIWSKSFFPDTEARAIFNAAIEGGINHFDTGPSYGPGIGEERLGRFLKTVDHDKLVVTTKVGTNYIDGSIRRSFSVETMLRSFEDSMARLSLDHVDMLYLHGPKVEDLTDDVFVMFERLKASGRITYSGVNSFDPVVLGHLPDTSIDAIMLQYNVSDLSAENHIDRLHAAGKIVMSGTALGRAKFKASTFLPTSRARLWYLLRILRSEPSFFFQGASLARRLTETGKSATEAAIQFVTSHPKLLSNLFGTSSVSHMVENAAFGHGSLTEAHWQRLLETA